MGKKKTKPNFLYIVPLLLALFVAVYSPQQLFASSANSSGGFSYQVELPENQIDPELGYYDLLMTPSQTQTISITMNNTSSDKITVELILSGAKTNSNGVIEYSNTTQENDPSLSYDFTQVVTGPDTVELDAQESKQVEFTIQMPESEFTGMLAGGITMKVASDTEEDPANATGSKVYNKYAYAVSIILRESLEELTPDLQYDRSYANQQNLKNTIFVRLSNVVATYLENLTIDAQITAENSEEVLWDARKTSMRMAPNSFIDFPISMAGDQMTAGIYTAHVKAYSGELKWEWTENFEITKEEADAFNEIDAGIVQDRSLDWRLIAGIITSVLFLMGVVTYFVYRSNKKKPKKKIKKTKKSRS